MSPEKGLAHLIDIGLDSGSRRAVLVHLPNRSELHIVGKGRFHRVGRNRFAVTVHGLRRSKAPYFDGAVLLRFHFADRCI